MGVVAGARILTSGAVRNHEARRGQASFEDLYSRYSQSVYNLVLRSVRDERLAEDLSQEVWIKVNRELVHLRDSACVKTWICRIAARTCVDAARKGSRCPVSDISEVVVATPEGNPEEISARREEARLTWEALGAMSLRQQSALFLREVEGHSYCEIAEIMEVSESAVEDLLFRARRGLAALYERMETAPDLRCGQAKRVMAAAIDGEATRAQRRGLRAHMDGCRECYVELGRMRQGSAAYLALPLMPASALLKKQVFSAIALGSSAAKGGGIALFTLPGVKMVAVGITLAGALSGGTLAVIGTVQPPGESRIEGHSSRQPGDGLTAVGTTEWGQPGSSAPRGVEDLLAVDSAIEVNISLDPLALEPTHPVGVVLQAVGTTVGSTVETVQATIEEAIVGQTQALSGVTVAGTPGCCPDPALAASISVDTSALTAALIP